MGIFRLFGHFTDAQADSQDIHRIIGEPARVAGPAEAGELRVVTWNIADGARFDRVVAEIHRLEADIDLLQEVDVCCRRSGNRNVAKDLADAIGANWVFAGEFQEIGESTGRVPALTGQAILSTYPITEAAAVPFRAQAWARWHLNPVQPRRGGRLVLQARTAGVRVYHAHLESGRDHALRRKQMDDILAADARDQPAAASRLAGNFNNGPLLRSWLFAAIATARFVNALDASASSQTTRVRRHDPVDWIFVRHLQPTSGQAIRVDGVSDHYPVTAILRLHQQVRSSLHRRFEAPSTARFTGPPPHVSPIAVTHRPEPRHCSMDLRAARRPATSPLPCHCGAPRPALRLAVIAAIVTGLVGLLIAGVRMAGAAAPVTPVASAAPGSCRPLPIARQHHYRMAAKVRPLLFWIGRDNVGEADAIWRRGADGALGYELLIGSDPTRAPRQINRWGYIAEQIEGSEACLLGVMKQSDEASIEEAKARLASEGQDGRYVFKAIRAVATPDEARASVTTVNVPRDLTLHDLPALLDILTGESRGTPMRSVHLPSGTRPGFLVALAEIVHTNVEGYRQSASAASRSAGPVTFVYNGTLHDLTLRRSELLRTWSAGTRKSTNVVRATFESRNRKTGEKTKFELVYGTDGPLAEIPLHATYQPRWWFQVELVLDDDVAF